MFTGRYTEACFHHHVSNKNALVFWLSLCVVMYVRKKWSKLVKDGKAWNDECRRAKLV
jgi:hypothetical protein